jgi:membrane protein implicated in regulation of membrane protease activity
MVAGSIASTLGAVGDLTGNWSWTVWLLIPLVLVLAYITARSLGPQGEPPPTENSSRGVSAYLSRHADAGRQEP